MKKENKRSLAEVEKTFYETMSKNSVFSALNRSATQLEKLNIEIKKASESSEKLTKSLNRLTIFGTIIAGVGVLVAIGNLILAILKYSGKS